MQNSSFSNEPFAQNDGRAEIEREMEAGEKLLWAGRPVAAARKREKWSKMGNHLAGIVFSLVWTGFASQGLIGNIRLGRNPDFIDLLFPAFGLLFLGGIIRDLLRERDQINHTFYGVTDRRALIVFAGETREVRSFAPHQIQLGRREREGNLGDVLLNDTRLLEKERPPTSFRLHTPQKSDEELEREIAFLSIENPREVERLIRGRLLDTNSQKSSQE